MKKSQIRKGNVVRTSPVGFVRSQNGRLVRGANPAAQRTVRRIFGLYSASGSIRKVLRAISRKRLQTLSRP